MSLQMCSRIPALIGSLLVFSVAGCADGNGPSEPVMDMEMLAASRAGLVCAAVDLEGASPLGTIPTGFEGAGSIGGLPTPTTFAGITGTLHSYVTSGLTPVGSKGQGATHLTLVHVFTSASGSFFTDDRAVCSPIPGALGTCRLSDQLTIAGGDGAFAEAAGKLHNRGVLDFNTFTLTFHATGKICGAGL